MKQGNLSIFFKYVSLNVLGMIGLSCYILADTYFISKALGATGIAALNFSISIYSIIHGTGLMIGIGGATRYRILQAQSEKSKANSVFTTCIKLGLAAGLLFALVGIFGSSSLATWLGADVLTLPLTKTYLTTILCFSPFFIMNNVLLAFIRNDNNPRLSMIAMLVGSFSNIVLDYIFMFPFKLGMFGAAFATGLAPIISMMIQSTHWIRKKNECYFVKQTWDWLAIYDILALGFSAFITEISSAIVLITCNLVMLRLRGNVGVASYGIVANLALVGASIFTGIAQGIQPLVSQAYGMNQPRFMRTMMRYAIVTSLAVALLLYGVTYQKADLIIGIFNSEQLIEIENIAKVGLKLYFTGFFFAGINVLMAMYFSAIEYARLAFFISITRGCVLIVPMVIVLSLLFDMTGLWLAFVICEAMVLLLTIPIVNNIHQKVDALCVSQDSLTAFTREA